MTKTPRTALVFGGSRGIGAACVEALAADGWLVAYTYRDKPTGPSIAQAYQADVCDSVSVAAAFDAARADFGVESHAVVANAGINVPPAPVAQFDPQRFRELVEVNLIGAFNVLSEAARRVTDGGSIIALTTSMVRVAVPGGGPYTATKAAVESLIRSMSRELASRGIRVNAVAPGPVDTDLFRAGKTEEAKQRSASLSPFSRVARPEEVASVVRFLLSEESSWVHGQVVQPNGGMV